MTTRHTILAAVFAAFALAPTFLAGNTCTWQGGSGKFSDANWDTAPVSGNDDTLVFDTTDGTAISVENDLADDFAVSKVRFATKNENDGICGKVTLTGKGLSFTGDTGSSPAVVWENGDPATANNRGAEIVFDLPVRFTNKCAVWVSRDLTFNKKVTLDDSAFLYLWWPGAPSESMPRFKNPIPVITFHDEVYGPRATLVNEAGRGGGTGSTIHYKGKVSVKDFKNCPTLKSQNMQVHLLSPANEIGSLSKMSSKLFLSASPCLGSNTVITAVNGGGYWEHIYVTGGDVVCDRIVSPADFHEEEVRDDNASGRLTMRASADGRSGLRFTQTVSLVWDPRGDYTYTLNDSTNTTSGTLEVKGGTFKLKGTTSFSALSEVIVRSGATLDLSECSAAAPIAASARLTVDVGGSIVPPANGSVTFASGTYGGLPLAAGDYTTGWVSAGTVTIASSSLEAGVSYWANPSGGDWNVAANWMPAVVPGADAEARITIQGAEDYTVRFAGTEPKPAKIVVGTDIAAKARLSIAGEAAFTPHTWIEVNRGGEIVVPSGGRFVYDQATNTVGIAQMIKIANGRFVVDGGYAMVTNAFGYTWVSGADGELLVENGGELVLADRANGSGNGCLRLVQGGALRMTGGTIDIPSRFYASYLNQDIDGVCDFSGGTLKLRRETETARIWFSGDATFSDSVVWTNSSANVAISPRANGGAMTFSMKDNATMTGSEPYVYIGGMGDTTVQMDSTGRIQARQGNVGVAKGHALYRQTAGLASFGTCGLSAGMTKQRDPSAGSDAADNAVTGTVEVAGGALVVDGSAAGNTSWNGGASNMFPPGTVLGYGGTAHPPASGRPYVGRMAISGTGALTNRYGHILVGVAPHGEGSLVLDGGTLRSTCEKVAGQGDFRELIACAVGVGGGKGEFLVRGGECAISNNVWIGGVSTNALRVPVGVSGVTLLAYPYETHGGEGLLEVSGGSVAFGRDLVVGAEGTGVVSVVGSRISAFTVGRDLVLTNEAAIVVGGAETATLRFKADANGVTPIEVAGKLVVTPQAKLEIDLTDFDIQHADSLTLATYAAKEGAFGADRITLTGCVPEATVVRVKETRIEVARRQPTVLVVR